MTDSPLWLSVASPLFTGLLGVSAALAGTALAARKAQRREDLQWRRQGERQEREWEREREERLRDIRGELHLALAEYAQSKVDDDLPDRGPVPDLLHRDRLTARVHLYASSGVQAAWDALGRAETAISVAVDKGEMAADPMGQVILLDLTLYADRADALTSLLRSVRLAESGT